MQNKAVLIGVFSVAAIVFGVSLGLVANRPSLDAKRVVVSSLMPERTIEEMTRGSYATVVGLVTGVSVTREKSLFRADEMDIVTVAEIKVDRYLSNPNSLDLSMIKVKTLGGSLDGYTVIAEDSPKFEVGTKVVLFLDKLGDGDFWVFGEAQGKFTVNEDGALGTDEERPFLRDILKTEKVTLSELESRVTAATK